MSTRQTQQIGKILPLPIDDSEFARLSQAIAEWIERKKETSPNSVETKLLEAFGSESVDLVNQLMLLARTPRHHHEPATHHNYRNTFDSHNQNEEFTQTKYEQHNHHQVNQEIIVVSDKCHMLKLTADLTINVASIIGFRRSTRTLITPGSDIILSELESSRLDMYLRNDYNV